MLVGGQVGRGDSDGGRGGERVHARRKFEFCIKDEVADIEVERWLGNGRKLLTGE